MTKKEAAIVSAYTGFLCGEFSEMHKYVEEKLGIPVYTHQFADKEFVKMLKEKVKKDFISMNIDN